jgi:hypothetical protein
MAKTKIRGNTQIIDGSILNAQISASAAIATSKLAEGADFLKRDGSVAFTANIPAGGFRITNLGAPVGANDAARKADVDAAMLGLNVKLAARVATTAPVDLADELEAGDSIDGITLVAGDRVLVKNQVDASENGIYVASVSGAASRASDADASGDFPANTFLFVSEGTVNADVGFVSTNDGAFVLDTDDLVFTQFSGVSSGAVDSASNVGTVGVGVFKQLTGSDLEFYKLNSANNRLSIAVISSDRIDLTVNEGNIDHNALANYDVAQHRIINDAGTSATELWSASKISTELSSKLNNSGYTSAHIVVANGSGVLAGVALSGDATISNAGVLSLAANVLKEADFVFNETPSGDVDAVNDEYVLANTPIAGSVQVFLNGLLQDVGGSNDYTIAGDTITFVDAPEIGDKIRVSYLK